MSMRSLLVIVLLLVVAACQGVPIPDDLLPSGEATVEIVPLVGYWSGTISVEQIRSGSQTTDYEQVGDMEGEFAYSLQWLGNKEWNTRMGWTAEVDLTEDPQSSMGDPRIFEAILGHIVVFGTDTLTETSEGEFTYSEKYFPGMGGTYHCTDISTDTTTVDQLIPLPGGEDTQFELLIYEDQTWDLFVSAYAEATAEHLREFTGSSVGGEPCGQNDSWSETTSWPVDLGNQGTIEGGSIRYSEVFDCSGEQDLVDPTITSYSDSCTIEVNIDLSFQG